MINFLRKLLPKTDQFLKKCFDQNWSIFKENFWKKLIWNFSNILTKINQNYFKGLSKIDLFLILSKNWFKITQTWVRNSSKKLKFVEKLTKNKQKCAQILLKYWSIFFKKWWNLRKNWNKTGPQITQIWSKYFQNLAKKLTNSNGDWSK